jgi:hypothetical protein
MKPLYLQTYFRLAASGLRGKAAADNQSLRLHRPQATVSPTAVPGAQLWLGVGRNMSDDVPLSRARRRTVKPFEQRELRGNVTIRPELKIGDQQVTRQ